MSVTASGTNFVVSYLDSLTAIGRVAIKARVISGAGSNRLPPFSIAGPRDGKVPAGFIANFNGSKYFVNMLRGVQSSGNDPGDVGSWIQKDIYNILLTIPVPP